MTEEEIDRLASALLPRLLAAVQAARRPFTSRPLMVRPSHASEPVDVLAGPVVAALAGRERVTVRELAQAVGLAPEQVDRGIALRFGLALRALGWEPQARVGTGRRERVYASPAARAA